MQANIKICDVCMNDWQKIVPATGFYFTDEGDSFDACNTHMKEVKKYNFAIHRFKRVGDFEPT